MATPTGRTPSHPNLQGIPHRTPEVTAIRNAFLARIGATPMPEDHIQQKTDAERGRFVNLLDQLRAEFSHVQAERDTALRALAIVNSGLERKPSATAPTAPPATPDPDAKPADCPATMAYGEYAIIKACIHELLEQGFEVSVNDGEETTVRRSRDPKEILAAMGTTESDYLLVHSPGAPAKAVHSGWVRFVYGNESFEVLSDHTVNLDLTRTHETIQEVEDRGI